MSGLISFLQHFQPEENDFEKLAFTPMPGGAPPPDPAMMDPAMAGGAPPMDPSMGGMPMDPAMMAAAGGAPPADIMAQQGMPVDPAMAMAGGAPQPPPPAGDPAAAGAGAVPPEIQAAIDQAVQAATGGGGGGAGGKGGNSKDKMDMRLNNIESMLNQVLGYISGKIGKPLDVGGSLGSEASAELGAEAAGAEANPENLGGPVTTDAAPKVASYTSEAEQLVDLMRKLTRG